MKPEEITTYGSWVKDRVLGVGGFGIVTLWRKQDEYIALKKCRWENVSFDQVTAKQRERWTLEVNIMKRLNHPNVVRFVQLPEDFSSMRAELPVLSMEYCSLGDLRQVLNKPENCCGLQEPEVRRIMTDVKNAISYLHKERITHRDLKPENIVLQHDDNVPEGVIYKLIDLGYAKVLDHSSICNSFVGTLQYLAPELLYNTEYTSSVDYWSLGLVSHEVITGVRPFLPNFTPAQWMMHVRKKKFDEICAYQNVADGKIIFSTELFKENYISDYLKEQLEKWLRYALEWDPKMRGGEVVNGKPIMFDLLDTIFNKKIVTVFCLAKYRRLSYEIDSATAVSTLKTWIERDAGQPASDQLLLLPDGDVLDDTGLADACWQPSCENDVMLYVLPKTHLRIPVNVQPYIPDFVKFLLKSVKEPMEFALQRRTCAHCIYFMDQELSLYRNLIDSYGAKLSSLIGQSDKLASIHREVIAKLERLRATHDFARRSLEKDANLLKETKASLSIDDMSHKPPLLIHYEPILMNQQKKFVSETQILIELEEKSRVLGRRLADIKRKVSLQHKILIKPGTNWVQEMQALLKAGYNCLAGLRREKDHHSSSARVGKPSAYDLCKPVYNFLKIRDKALNNDENFNQQLRDLEAFDEELAGVETPVKQLQQNISDSCDRVVAMQLARQQELWKCCNFTRTSLSFQIGPDYKVSSHQGTVSSVNRPDNSEPVKRPAASVPTGGDQRSVDNASSRLDSSSLHSGDLLTENESLRYFVMDSMSSVHRCLQTIKSESKSMDWNSLLNPE